MTDQYTTLPAYEKSYESDIVVMDEIMVNNNNNDNDNDDNARDDDNNTKDGSNKTTTKRQVGGAAVVGGMLGFAIAGPLIGVAFGIGAAVASTTKSKAGDVARASGDVMAAAGDRLKKLNQKHHVVEKTSDVVIKGCKTISKKLHQQPKNSTTTTTTTARTGEINATVI